MIGGRLGGIQTRGLEDGTGITGKMNEAIYSIQEIRQRNVLYVYFELWR